MKNEYLSANASLTERARKSEGARERAQLLLSRASKITVDTANKLKELQSKNARISDVNSNVFIVSLLFRHEWLVQKQRKGIDRTRGHLKSLERRCGISSQYNNRKSVSLQAVYFVVSERNLIDSNARKKCTFWCFFYSKITNITIKLRKLLLDDKYKQKQKTNSLKHLLYTK